MDESELKTRIPLVEVRLQNIDGAYDTGGGGSTDLPAGRVGAMRDGVAVSEFSMSNDRVQ